MNQMGELVLARNQILQYLDGNHIDMLHHAANTLDQVTTQLQANMMKTRLQPIGNVFRKFPRIVRDLAKQSGKDIALVIEGQETEVDRTLLEAITDPLTHIIRNAADHAIELPAERVERGKKASGTIQLRAFHKGEHIVVQVKDDGKGIDTERIKAKALDKGLISNDQATTMTHAQAINLILLPGFSTAETITNLSGRGVGMDVVKSELQKVNGILHIDTELGIGTTFTLEIPLTLAIIPALIIQSHEELFAIPQFSTVEILRRSSQQDSIIIQRLKDAPFLFFREEWIPLKSLSHLFGMESQDETQWIEEHKDAFIVVVRSGGQQFGLIVDQILDSEEIVVKPLIHKLRKLGIFSGTTVLGSGQVILILDIPGILRQQNLSQREVAEEAKDVENREQLQLLICSLGNREQIAVPLNQVTRIEAIQTQSIQQVGHTEAITLGESLVRLYRLDTNLPVSPVSVSDSAHILIRETDTSTVGVLISHVVDSIDYIGTVQNTIETAPGILGTILLNNLGIHMIDLDWMLEQHHAAGC